MLEQLNNTEYQKGYDEGYNDAKTIYTEELECKEFAYIKNLYDIALNPYREHSNWHDGYGQGFDDYCIEIGY